jgi:GH25 family lysozyme M1 (1,4-beta-N-acetylmuramidase)
MRILPGARAARLETLLALDWENNPDGPDMTPAQARAFLEELMRRTGRHASSILVYGGNVLKDAIQPADDAYFARFPLWLCEYGPTARLPRAWKSYYLWQYSETGKIDGMAADGHVDLNVIGTTDPPWEWAQPGRVIPSDRQQSPAAA